jgi:hypothetical protein
MSPREDERRSVIHSTVGGVMTDEVGVVTGDLEIATRLPNAGVFDVRVRYAGAEEWYTVAGSPVSADGRSFPAEELHEHVVEYLTTPRPGVGGNEEPTSLRGFLTPQARSIPERRRRGWGHPFG